MLAQYTRFKYVGAACVRHVHVCVQLHVHASYMYAYTLNYPPPTTGTSTASIMIIYMLIKTCVIYTPTYPIHMDPLTQVEPGFGAHVKGVICMNVNEVYLLTISLQ